MNEFTVSEMLDMQRQLQEKIKTNGNQYVRIRAKINCYG